MSQSDSLGVGDEFVSLSDEDDDDNVSLVVPYDGDRSKDFLGPVYTGEYRNVDVAESGAYHIAYAPRPTTIRYMRRKKIPQAKAWDDDEATVQPRTEWVALDNEEWARRTGYQADQRVYLPKSSTCLTPGCENPTERRTPRDCCYPCYRYQARNEGQWPNEVIIQRRQRRRAQKDTD